MEDKILMILEKNSRIALEEVAAMVGLSLPEVSAIIQDMMDKKIICGYTTLVNWDKMPVDFVTALIEVKALPQRGQGFDAIARRIYEYDEVKSVYLMSGGFDLTVIVEGKNIKDISYFVSDKLATIDAVQGTATHFVLKKYKDHGIIMEEKLIDDERMIMSP